MSDRAPPRPLEGKRIVITRARGAAESFADELRARGAVPMFAAAIEVSPPTDPSELACAAREARSFDWVVFTSPNGVEAFVDELGRQGQSPHVLGETPIAVVGPGTARVLERVGLRAALVADEHHGEGLASALRTRLSGREPAPKVLLARAEVARNVVPDALRAMGCEVRVVAAYRTTAPPPETFHELVAFLESGGIDVVAFTASSTVTNLCAALGERARELLDPVVVATIGPPTTATARGQGLRVDVEARRSTMTGLIEAIEAHFAPRV